MASQTQPERHSSSTHLAAAAMGHVQLQGGIGSNDREGGEFELGEACYHKIGVNELQSSSSSSSTVCRHCKSPNRSWSGGCVIVKCL